MLKSFSMRTLAGTLLAVSLFSACGDKTTDKPTDKDKVAATDKDGKKTDGKPADPNAVKPAEKPAEGAVTVDPSRLGMFGALPENWSKADPADAARVKLGQMLYHDKRLSLNHDVSCNSCHMVDKYGVDSSPTSTGHKLQKGGRNAPTVFNAAGHFVQFWDGRAADVEAQAKGPVLNPIEMAMPNEKRVIDTLKSIPEYVKSFGEAFAGSKDPVTFDNMAVAIGAFERKLSTPAPFDKFVKGDMAALNDEQKRGFNAFIDNGCMACHNGALLGGGMYQKAGLVKPWPNQKDQGRFDITKAENDKMFFKVPSLRNIEKTAPYFHDGSIATLEEAVKMMGEYQLGKTLDDKTVSSIVAFLKSLTGTPPADLIAVPTLPASTDKTPKAGN